MGRHILVLNTAASGHVIPTLALVAELTGRGHRVSYAATDRFASLVERAGAQVLRYALPASASMRMNTANSASDLVEMLHENSAIGGAVQPRFAGAPPDLIVYDTTAFFIGRVLPRNWRVPAVELSTTFASNDHFSLMKELENRAPKQRDMAVMGEFITGLTSFIAAHGPDITVTSELLASPEALSVVNVCREFQVAGDTFDERWVFAGPCLGNRAFQGQWQPPGDDPVLLASFGTMNYENRSVFLKTCVSAFAGLAWHVVLSTGMQVDPAELGPLPANMEAHRQVPQLAILGSAKLFVSHCGMGGTMEALSRGVPILAVPQTPEQTVIADRIVELGLGRQVTWDIGADELRAAVLELAADEAAARAAEQMCGHIQKAGGAPRAADEIESYMCRADRTVP
jgi:calicheamicin 4-deoxy-4-thio-alpha-D-digitoxosyltransferase